MAKSPGHRKWPDHKVQEIPLDQRVKVEVGGEVVAQSDNVIKVAEDHSPVRYYFPRADVAMSKLARTETTSECPFKGTAHYFSIHAGDKTIRGWRLDLRGSLRGTPGPQGSTRLL